MTFMTFYTPTYKRPTYLAACKRSVQMQTCQDYQHMVIVDDAGIGVDGMFNDIQHHTDRIRGDYVFILADDDRLLDPDGLERVKAFAIANNKPQVIIVKNYKWGRTLPDLWEQEPQYAHIDTGNFIIRTDVFRYNVASFGLRYEGDYDYIHHLWEAEYEFSWFDYVFSEMQVGGKGRTEEQIVSDGVKIRVHAIRSFVSVVDGLKYTVPKGKELDMPPGADWVTAGLAVPVRTKSVETAIKEPREKAVTRASKTHHTTRG